VLILSASFLTQLTGVAWNCSITWIDNALIWHMQDLDEVLVYTMHAYSGVDISLKYNHRKGEVSIASWKPCQCVDCSFGIVLILLIRAFLPHNLNDSRVIVLTLAFNAAYALVLSMPNESNHSIFCTDITNLLSPHPTDSLTYNHIRNDKSDCSLSKRNVYAAMHVSRLQSEGRCSRLPPTHITITSSILRKLVHRNHSIRKSHTC
jgi:hypothetical protein